MTMLKGNRTLSINGQTVSVSATVDGTQVAFSFEGAIQGTASATIGRTRDIDVGGTTLRVKAIKRNGRLVADFPRVGIDSYTTIGFDAEAAAA